MLYNWLLLSAGLALLIYLGFRASRIASSDDEAGYLLGGRSFGPLVAAGTLMATGFSGWGFVGSPGSAYEYGFTELLANFFFAPAILIAILFFSSHMRRRALTLGSLTLPEYIAHQHNAGPVWARSLQGLGGLITVLMMMTFIIAQIKALGSITGQWLGLSENVAALIMISVIILYTATGGLAAVAWTDLVMLFGMCIAALLVVVQIFGDTSLGAMVADLKAIDPELVNPSAALPYGGFKAAAFLTLPWAFLWASVVPYMGIRFLAFKETTRERDVALIGLPMGLLLSLVPLVGVYVRSQGILLSHPDDAMATYLSTYMHSIGAGVISLFIVFAMSSTANSILHTMGSAASNDLRKSLFTRKVVMSRTKVVIHRVVLVTFGAFGYILYLASPPFFINFLAYLGTGTLQAMLIGPVFVATFWRGNAAGAFSSMVGGFLTCTLLLFLTDLGWVVAPLVADVVAVSLYVGVSLLTLRRIPRSELRTATAQG
jgi:sodium/pantothenate symporter